MSSTRELLQPTAGGRRRTFCCHSATLSGRWAPNSLEAVRECVEAGTPRIEIDVRFTADDSMVVLHDDALEAATTGCGRVSQVSRRVLTEVAHAPGAGTLAFLEDVVAVVAGSGTLLQVDLKLMRPIGEARAAALQAALEPMGHNVIVGSQAHWNLRALERVRVAFDPARHFRYGPAGRPDDAPGTLGVHGFWDDAPFATNPRWKAVEYLRARIDDLGCLAPRAVEWMVDIPTVLRMGELGIALGEELHARGRQLAAWTVRHDFPERGVRLPRLFALGVDTVITDVPLLCADEFSGMVV